MRLFLYSLLSHPNPVPQQILLALSSKYFLYLPPSHEFITTMLFRPTVIFFPLKIAPKLISLAPYLIPNFHSIRESKLSFESISYMYLTLFKFSNASSVYSKKWKALVMVYAFLNNRVLAALTLTATLHSIPDILHPRLILQVVFHKNLYALLQPFMKVLLQCLLFRKDILGNLLNYILLIDFFIH